MNPLRMVCSGGPGRGFAEQFKLERIGQGYS